MDIRIYNIVGYDNARAWQTLIQSKQADIARIYKIPLDDLRWYAAFHNKDHHPHIHMLSGNNNIIGNGNSIGEKLSEPEAALLDLFKKLNVVKQAQLLAYVAELEKEG